MSRKKLILSGLMSLALAAVGGCAQKAVKSDDASPPAEAAISDDEKRFLEVMEMLHQIKEGTAKPPAVSPDAATKTAAAPGADSDPVPSKDAKATQPVKPPQEKKSTPPVTSPPQATQSGGASPAHAAAPAVAAASAIAQTPAPAAPAPASPAADPKAPAPSARADLPEPLTEAAAVPISAKSATPAEAPIPRAPESVERVVEAKEPPTPAVSVTPQEVMAAIKMLTTHPRVRYAGASGQYAYYAGGTLDAKYDVNTNQLFVSNDISSGSAAVQCQYSQDGQLISDKKGVAPLAAACGELIRQLSAFLSR